MKRFSLVICIVLLGSCVDIEDKDNCLELRKEYKELMFHAQYGTSMDRAVFDFWLELNEKELELCK